MRRGSVVWLAGFASAVAVSLALFAWLSAGAFLPVAAQIALSMTVIAAAYRLMPFRSGGGWIVLGAAWIAALALASANCHYFTEGLGGTLAEPTLCNKDAYYNYYVSVNIADSGMTVNTTFSWRLLWAAAMLVFGKNIVAATLVNVAAGALSLVFMGYIAGMATGSRRAAAIVMAMAAAMAYMMAVWTVLLKDALVTLAMAMLISVMVRTLLKRGALWGRKGALLGAIFFAGAALLCVMRFMYVPFAALGVIIFGWGQWRRVLALAAMLAVCSGLYMWHQSYSESTPAYLRHMAPERYNARMDYIDRGDSDQEGNIHHGYNKYAKFCQSLPKGVKVLLTPVNAAVQWIIPLPWTGGNDSRFGPAMVYAHQGWVWYGVGFLILFYICCASMRRGSPRELRMLTLWGAVIWLVPPYMTAGLVSRYGLSLLPALLPAAAWAWMHRGSARRMGMWAAAYAVIILAALAGAYYLSRF